VHNLRNGVSEIYSVRSKTLSDLDELLCRTCS